MFGREMGTISAKKRWSRHRIDGYFLESREIRFFVHGAWFNRTVSRDRMENLHVFLELARTRYDVECIGTGKLG